MKVVLSLLFVAAFACVTFADVPSPNKQKREIPRSWNGSMMIRTRSDVGIATLKIHKDKLKQLRAAIDEADDQQNTAAVTNEGAGRGQTMVAGLLLSIAMMMGGFVIFRRSDRASKKVALSIAAVSVVGIGAVVVFANTPPPSIVGLTSRIFDKDAKTYGYAKGQIAIQIVDDKYTVDDVVLEIPAVGEDKR